MYNPRTARRNAWAASFRFRLTSIRILMRVLRCIAAIVGLPRPRATPSPARTMISTWNPHLPGNRYFHGGEPKTKADRKKCPMPGPSV
ncbi:MAG: hypothetical protein ACLSUW_02240 [Akkermansia sp.]